MRILASTRPQSRFASAVPKEFQSVIGDSAFAMTGTASRIFVPDGEQPQADDYLPSHPRARAKWEKVADVAVEMGFATLTLDGEWPWRNALDIALSSRRAARWATDAVAIVADWCRQRQPKLKLAFHHMAPAMAAMHLTEDTPAETLAAYDELLGYEKQQLAPDEVVLIAYYTGPGWRDYLAGQAWLAAQLYPDKPRRVLLSIANYATGAGIKDELLRRLIRQAAEFGTPELWVDEPQPDYAARLWAVVADVANKGA